MDSISFQPESSSLISSARSLSFARKWSILGVLSLALAVIIIDTTILNVALSAIIKDFKTDIQSLQWVITGYSLTLAALTITGGRLGDIFGRKRMFVLGAALFGIGSLVVSLSQDVTTMFIGVALIEGMGAALMMPTTASLLVSHFKGQDRAIAFGIWGGIAGASVALGPVLGGFLTTYYSWRWGFRMNLVIVLVLLLGSLLIPKAKREKQKLSLDIVGVFLSALGLLVLVFAFIESSDFGWFRALEHLRIFGQELILPGDMSIVPLLLVAAAGILSVFMWWERRHEAQGQTPLVSLHLFENRTFTAGMLIMAFMTLGQAGLIFALPVYLQSVLGLDAYETGLTLLPLPMGLLIVSPLAAVLSRKFIPAKYIISLGMFLNVSAYVFLWLALGVDASAADLVLGLSCYGIGIGFVMSQINNVTLSSVEMSQAGEASGVNNTLRQIGSTLGSAVLGAILLTSLSGHMADGIYTSTVIPKDRQEELVAAAETQATEVEFGGGLQLEAGLPDEIKAEVRRISRQATVEAAKRTLAYGSLSAFMGLCIALAFLPRKTVVSKVT